jgi:ATP-dependent Clp protease protease subunit
MSENVDAYDEDGARVAKLQAEARQHSAHARYFDSQTAGQEIDNRTASALAASAELALKRERLKDTWDEASNGRNRVYHFTDTITADSVEPVIDVLNRWQRMDRASDREWRFVICSDGGHVVAGMKLYATLKAIASTRRLVTVASGMCASMATVVFQAGTTRIIEPGTSFMLHDVSGGVGGSLGTMTDTMKYFNMLNSQLHKFLAERSNKTAEEIAELSRRQDAWFLPDQVIEMGLADAIGYAAE